MPQVLDCGRRVGEHLTRIREIQPSFCQCLGALRRIKAEEYKLAYPQNIHKLIFVDTLNLYPTGAQTLTT